MSNDEAAKDLVIDIFEYHYVFYGFKLARLII